MANVKMLSVLLDRKWSGHEAGETVTVEDYTAKSMVRKNYGRILSASERKKIESPEPKVETADAPPAAEKAVVTPEIGSNIIPTEKEIKKMNVEKLNTLAGNLNIDISGCQNKKEVIKTIIEKLNKPKK